MPEPETWEEYRDERCRRVEDLLGFRVRDKERLIRAILSKALLNEPGHFPQLEEIGTDPGLETKGDFILDFAIFDHFAPNEKFSGKEIDDFRQSYGGNEALQVFAKEHLNLQELILWGPDQKTRMEWDQPATIILADRFEMLIAVVYFEQDIDGVKKFLERIRFFKKMDEIKKKFLK
jgi:dsRNA-specific ribonuclease